MYNSALVAEGSELMWDSVLFLLHILKNAGQNGKNISIYLGGVTMFAKHASKKRI
jgi:hypothetical protein